MDRTYRITAVFFILLIIGFGIVSFIYFQQGEINGLSLIYMFVSILVAITIAPMIVVDIFGIKKKNKNRHEFSVAYDTELSNSTLKETKKLMNFYYKLKTSEINIYNPDEVTDIIMNFNFTREVWFVLSSVEDTDEPYYSMILDLVKKDCVVYYLLKEEKEDDQKGVEQISKLKTKLSNEKEIIELERNIDDYIHYVTVPNYVLFNNLCFINPREEDNTQKIAYATIKNEFESTVLVYKMSLSEMDRDWKRLEEAFKVDIFISNHTYEFEKHEKKIISELYETDEMKSYVNKLDENEKRMLIFKKGKA